MTVAFVIPARNEESTIGPVVAAAVEAARWLGGTVVVVADHCRDTDNTASIAAANGAYVVELTTGGPSKSQAVVAGIDATTERVICLLDADIRGLTPAAIVRLVEPVLNGRAMMSVGCFDYGPWNTLVEWFPWSTGQRAFRRSIFPFGDARLVGYSLEAVLNEGVGKAHGTTISQIIPGLRHRTKLATDGVPKGLAANLRMWSGIARSADVMDSDAYRTYAANVVVEWNGHPSGPPRWLALAGVAVLEQASRALRTIAGIITPTGTPT